MKKNSKTNKTAPVAKTAKTAKVVEAPVQLPAVPVPTAFPGGLPAKSKEQPMWQGKPISAAGLVYHQRQEAGLCVKCGGKLAEGSKLLCDKHLAYHNEWHAARKARIDAAMAAFNKQNAAPVAVETVAAVVETATKPVAKATKPVAKPAKKAAKK